MISRSRHRFRMIIPAYPAFNVYSGIANRTTSLGPVHVATNVNKMENWDSEVIDENNFRLHGPRDRSGQVDHDLINEQRYADVVGLYGGLTSTIPRLYKIARSYKNKGATVIAGGQHFAQENIVHALKHGIDYVVLGEGEDVIRELLVKIEQGGDPSCVRGIAYLEKGKLIMTGAREPLTDFSAKPLPDFSLVRYARIKIFPVERIRGCGMDCEFCTVKGKPRAACPDRMLEQIRQLVETYDARHFFVVDDLFGQHREETLELCRKLRDYQSFAGLRLDLTVQIRLDKAKDAELLSAMRRAGINMVCIGFESPIAEELSAMNKHIRPENMVTMARTFHRHGFLVHGMFIFGYPMVDGVQFQLSAKERVARYKTFIRQARLDTIQVLLPVPLPGTELTERLKRQNRIYDLNDVGWEYYDGNFPLFEPDQPLTAEEMQYAQKKIMASFYSFAHFFRIGWDVLRFPALAFFFYNIRKGWKEWYRAWRNDLIGFVGWTILKKWHVNFKRDKFMDKLRIARAHLRLSTSLIKDMK